MRGEGWYQHEMSDSAKQHVQTNATMARDARVILRLMEPVATLLMSNRRNKGTIIASVPVNSEIGLKMK